MTVDLTAVQTSSSVLEGAGITGATQPAGRGGFLSDVVVDLGYATCDEVDRAVAEAREPGKRFERVLIKRGAIDEDQLARAIAERNGFAHVDLDEFAIDESAAKLISRDEAMRYRALPLAFEADGTLLVAMADPLDGLALSDIAAITKSEVLPAVASARRIAELADQLPKRKRFVLGQAEVMPKSVQPEAAEHESNEIEYEIKEVVEVKRVNKEDVAAEPIEALPPFGERGAQAFTIPDSVDDFDLPDPVVTEPTGSQASKDPEPLSAYEAAFGAAAEEAVEPEPRAFGPAPGSFETESEGELGKARVTNDELRTQLEDSRSRIEELESTDERLRITEQEVERLEEECRSSKAALLAAQAKLSAALADEPTAE